MGDEGFALGRSPRRENISEGFSSYVWGFSGGDRKGRRGVKYLFEQVLDGCLGLLFVVGRLWGDVGGLGELGILVEVAFCL